MNARRFLPLSLMLVFSVATSHADDKKPASKATAVTSTTTLTGSISDAMCGKSHMMPDKSAAECARECAKDGDYALVVGDKVYTLKGHKEDLEKLAGNTATVTGTLKGTTVEVASVTTAKASPAKAPATKPDPKKS